MLIGRQLGSCPLRSKCIRHVGSGTLAKGQRLLSLVKASNTDVHKEQLTLEYVIKQLQRSMRINPDGAARNVEMTVAGGGRHLGINITWCIKWRHDGAFYEEINGKELCFKWGYDGGLHSSVWEMDSSGVARSLECDDHEALLVCSWVRTGCWLQPHLMSRLQLDLEAPAASQPASAASRAGSAASQSKFAGSQPGSAASSSGRSGVKGNGRQQPQSAGSSGPSPPTLSAGTPWDQMPGAAGSMASVDGDSVASTSRAEEVNGPLVINLRVKGGKLLTRLRVCPRNWAVQGLDQPLCGDMEVWDFASWKAWQADVFYPEALVHQAVAGGQHVYRTDSARVGPFSPISTFQIPATPMLPADTQYDPSKPPAVPVWRAGSGHLLVRPEINGKEGGFMVLDTGASGFVITPRAAVALGLDSFGELFAASISGKVPTQFVKARTWSLGPLTISAPVMMTMSLDGLVRGGPPGGEIIGIVGYDIFRRAVIELPQMSKVGNTAAAAPRGDDSGSASDSGSGGLSISGPLPFLHAQRQNAARNGSSGGSSGSEPGSVSSVETDGGTVTGVATANAPSSSGSSGSSSGSSSSSSARPGSNGTGGKVPWDSSGRDSQQYSMLLYNPDQYTGELEEGWSWHPFRMIASLPHVEVRFLDADGAPLDVLLMLDSGACGADIMLHARAMSELKLGKLGRPTSHFVRGVGGAVADNSVRVEMVDLPWVELAGVRFTRVRCMYAGVGGLDISTYSAGIICGDLLGRLAAVIDYSRKRIGFKLLQDGGALKLGR